MTILINNPVQSTVIFSIFFILIFLFTLRLRKKETTVQLVHTQELKGLAILAVIFSHIGYFLASDDRFLFPFSIIAGVGLNLFLFLSGYGLFVSTSTKQFSIINFYKRHLAKLYIPLWFTIALFLILDFFILKRVYSFTYIWQSLLGYFPTADVWSDINSPLWYITFIVFYYLLFPLVFSKKFPWISAIIIYLASYLLVYFNPMDLGEVVKLYRMHLLAFPLGVLVGGMVSKYNNSWFESRVNETLVKLKPSQLLKSSVYYLLVTFFVLVIAYTAYYSHVGDGFKLEQGTSLITWGTILLLFSMTKFESRLLYWFGFYSYEIYLLHWPIMSRFEIFYQFVPAWLATIFYLLFFIGMAWVFKYLVKAFTKIF
jgi:peptidoglycan/LPS O-acetylase OafA/YrhL